MNREELKELLINKNSGKRIPVEEQLEYFKRLIKPYGNNQYFIEQYLRADGKELSGKFWSSISSSRFAFEMYSWLANEKEKIKNIKFELKLVGITPTRGVPNMDVFIECTDRLIFIESKLTESYPQVINCEILPAAYWKEKGDKEALTTSNKPIGSTLKQRYHSDEDALKEFLSFIKLIKDELNKLDSSLKPNTWMEYGQEIKHLYGLYFYLKNNKEYHNKIVEFYNIYYDLEDEINDVINLFFDEGEDMMNRLLAKYKINFKYMPKTAQEVVKTFPDDAIAYGLDVPVKTLLKEKFYLE